MPDICVVRKDDGSFVYPADRWTLLDLGHIAQVESIKSKRVEQIGPFYYDTIIRVADDPYAKPRIRVKARRRPLYYSGEPF